MAMPHCLLFTGLWSGRCGASSPCLSFSGQGREIVEQIRSLALAQDASKALKAGVELVGKSWAIRHRLCGRRGATAQAADYLGCLSRDWLPVWMFPETMSCRPPWSAVLCIVLALVYAAGFFRSFCSASSGTLAQSHIRTVQHRRSRGFSL